MTRLNCAVLTVSDTRTSENDTSGDLLVALLKGADHRLGARALEQDDIYRIRARVSAWIADPDINVVLSTGGTGFTGRDTTPEALAPLFDKTIDGFGELFRQLSYDEIGSSTIQSRALAGLANGTLIFALPGSGNAVRTGWEKIIEKQLDINNRPCNFAELVPRFLETR